MQQNKLKKTSPKKKKWEIYLQETPHFYLEEGNWEILGLGTAHVSKQSVKDVEKTFEIYQPHAVGVELCKPRMENLIHPKRWKNMDLSQVIKSNKFWLLVSSLCLASFQKKIGKEIGVMPGAEMKRAVQLSQQSKIDLVLVDREVRITLARVWAQVGFFSRMWLSSFLLSSLFISEKIEEKEIEKLKTRDMLEDLLTSLPPRYHKLQDAILKERDLFMAEKVREHIKLSSSKNKQKLMLVLGAAHLKGVEKTLKQKKKVDIESLNQLPPKKRLKNLFSWILFGLFFLGLNLYFFQKELNMQTLGELAWAWTLSRSIGAGLGALLTLPSLPSLLATVLIAPFSYFLGFLGIRLWMASALVELKFKKPQVEDFESITRDTQDMKSFSTALYKNRVLHLIFLIMSVSFGLTIGNLFFFKVVLEGIFF